jgi:CheY-like chemotaxis protein
MGGVTMVVDDNIGFAENLAEILELAGRPVVAADNGDRALALARGVVLSRAFIDLRMPGMDGIETYHRLRDLHPDAQYVLMSAYDPPPTVASAVEDGAQFVTKPFDLNAVLGIGES